MYACQIFQVIQQQFWQPSVGDFSGTHPGGDKVFFFVMMTANSYKFWFDILTVNYHYICYCFHFESILYTIIITIYNYIAIRTLAM